LVVDQSGKGELAVDQSGKGELAVDQSGIDQLTLHRTNTLAYLSGAGVTKKNDFITLTSGGWKHLRRGQRRIPGANLKKTFFSL
jgi:hypothetical protein